MNLSSCCNAEIIPNTYPGPHMCKHCGHPCLVRDTPKSSHSIEKPEFDSVAYVRKYRDAPFVDPPTTTVEETFGHMLTVVMIMAGESGEAEIQGNNDLRTTKWKEAWEYGMSWWEQHTGLIQEAELRGRIDELMDYRDGAEGWEIESQIKILQAQLTALTGKEDKS